METVLAHPGSLLLFAFLVAVVLPFILLSPAIIAGFIWNRRVAIRLAVAHLTGIIFFVTGVFFIEKWQSIAPFYVVGAMVGAYLSRRFPAFFGSCPLHGIFPEDEADPGAEPEPPSITVAT